MPHRHSPIRTSRRRPVSGDGYILFLTSADGVRTKSFGVRAEEAQYYCVGDGVNELYVDALGGSGGGGGRDFDDNVSTGGSGSGVQAVVAVTERKQLKIEVGHYGGASGGWGNGRGGGRGTADSGASYSGAGGGGSTSVSQTDADCDASTHDARSEYLVIGGGGGGGGGNGFSADGGDGGAAGIDPEDGKSGGFGGGPGGLGGEESGTKGGDGSGSSTGGGGGGGGGGHRGGGKGHGANDGDDGGGGGGGGGQSFVRSVSGQAPFYYSGPNGDFANVDGRNDGHVDLVVPIPAKRSRVELISGNSQSAYSDQQFAQPLRVRFVDAIKGPEANKSITFTLPSTQGAAAKFSNGESSISVNTDSEGFAETTIKALPAAEQASLPEGFVVNATVTDDPAHLIGETTFRLHDVEVPTSIEVTTDATDYISQPGQPVTFTAKVSQRDGTTPSFGTPGGHVQFKIDGNDVGGPLELNSGTVTLPPVSNLLPGTHHILATYLGDDPNKTFAPVFGSVGLLVDADGQTMTLESSHNPSYPGQPVTFSAIVVPDSGVTDRPTGTVQFEIGGNPIGEPVPLAATGPASATSLLVDNLPLGTTVVTATYSGDARFASNTKTLDHNVAKLGTETRLTLPPPPVLAGAVVGATVTGAAGAPKPTGAISFSQNGTSLGEPVPLDADGSATSPPLGAGTGVVEARYLGNDVYLESTAQQQIDVYTRSSTTTVTANRNPVAFFQQLDLTATITTDPTGPVTAGTVQFAADGAAMGGPVPVVNGKAVLVKADFSKLKSGAHVITAAYTGDTAAGIGPSTGQLSLSVLNVGQQPGDAPSDVSIDVATPQNAPRGSTVPTTITVRNNGAQPSNGVTVTVSHLMFARIVDPAGGQVAGNTVTFAIPTLAPQQTVTYTVVLEAQPRLGLGLVIGRINTATRDSNVLNNIDYTATFVR